MKAEAQADFLAQLFRPLLSPQAAAFLLAASAKHVVRMCEARQLLAVNIALTVEAGDEAMDERAQERMLRILRPSVERLVIPALAKTRLADLRWDQAVNAVHHRDTWTRREVQQFLDCSEDHARRLSSPISATEPAPLTGPKLTQTGSGRLQLIHRSSLLGFLQARELNLQH